MKNFLEKTITLIGAIIVLIVCILWYFWGNGSYGAIATGIPFIITIITSLFLKTKKENGSNTVNLKNSDNNTIIRDNKGKIKISIKK